MCYYAFTIFSGCGHAVPAAKPIEGLSGCPYRRKEMSDRQFMRTPSLTSSISTQPSPRTTVGSFESLPAPKEEGDMGDLSETPCAAKLWHPLHIRRFRGLCDACETGAQSRLAGLELSIAEGQTPMIQKARRDKVRIEGRKPRQLELLRRQDMEKAAKAVLDAHVVKHESQRPASPKSVRDSTVTSAPSQSSSTMSYMRGLWAAPKTTKLPPSPRDSGYKSFIEEDDGPKKPEAGPVNIAPEDVTITEGAGQDDQAAG